MSLFDGYLAVAEEPAYNVETAPTRFLALVDGGILPIRGKTDNKARRAGVRVPLRGSRFTRGAKGQVKIEPETNGLGLLFKHALGTLVTAGAGPVYTHTATLGDLTGKSLTFELNEPFSDGSAAVFRASGAKVASWSLTGTQDQTVQMSFDVFAATWKAGAIARTATTALSTAVTGIADTSGIIVGQRVTGTGIAANTTVAAIVTNGVTLSTAATVAGTTILTFGLDAQHVTAAALTPSANVTVPSTTGYAIGQPVYGTLIPPQATIASITSSTVFVLTAPALGTDAAAEIVIGLTPTTPAYLAAETFPFNASTYQVTFNGKPAVGVSIKEISITADNGLTERPHNDGFKEAAVGELSNYNVSFKIEWNNFEAYRRYLSQNVADTVIGLVATFNGTIPITGSTTLPSVVVTFPALQLDADIMPPQSAGGILTQDIKAMMVNPTSGAPITVVVTTGSATP
jgi:hypothetical protein